MIVSSQKSVKSHPDVPEGLVYEEWGGKSVYYRGYKDVLMGIKTIEEVMSCSDLQGVLVSLINGFLFGNIDRKKYLLATNEIGLHLAKGDNLGNDLAIFEKEKVGKLTGKYFDVPPKIVIEIDIKADLNNFMNQDANYIFQKSQKMFDFGVEKVFWILTSPQKVFVMEKDNPKWYITNWSDDLQILENTVLNIANLLLEDQIDY